MADNKATIMVVKVVDLQCDRCYKKVKKLLCKFHEVKDQKYDEKANTVTISVVACDPERIKSKLCSKGRDCIKSIEIKVPDKKPPVEETKKEPEIKVAIYFCIECNTWHQGPCSHNQSKKVSFPCNENCGKRVCCGGCGGSGCRSCSGSGWFSWYCTNCSSTSSTSSTSWSHGGYNWCCKGCGSASCSGHCYGGGYNNWGCKGCGSLSCGGCGNSCNRRCNSSCGSCNGCSSGQCESYSQSRCIIM